MARESQGLQVLLIVFVMLTVVLGVTTFLYNKRADEATKVAAVESLGKQQVESEKKTVEEENQVLKTLIGLPERSTEEIKKQFAEDMQTYGNGRKLETETDKTGGDRRLFDAGALPYRRLLAGMQKVIQDRTGELIQAKSSLADQQRIFKNSQAAKDEQINTFLAGYGKLEDLAKKISGGYQTGERVNAEEIAEFVKQVAAIKRNAMEAAARAAENENALKKALQEKEKEIRELVARLRILEGPETVVPAGEITGVSLPNKMVWINRGRADALPRGMRFTVYSAGSNNAAQAVKKGTVEVALIEGEHSAQARILDDKIADPIMVGDKVSTPFWSPGQRDHFALTGIMNLDGDGRNQLNVVKGMINQNGGEVDCWLDEQGHRQGQFTADTRFIVVGDAPDKAARESMKNYSDMLRDAERYPVRKLTLSEFKQKIGNP